jgi:hypothetical protein
LIKHLCWRVTNCLHIIFVGGQEPPAHMNHPLVQKQYPLAPPILGAGGWYRMLPAQIIVGHSGRPARHGPGPIWPGTIGPINYSCWVGPVHVPRPKPRHGTNASYPYRASLITYTVSVCRASP